METLDGFILTRARRDSPRGLEFTYWLATGRGPVRVRITQQEAVFFVERGAGETPGARREAVELSNLSGQPVDALYFRNARDLRNMRETLGAKGIRTYESDVKPEDRYLMERFIRGAVRVEGTLESRGAVLECVDPVMRPSDFRPALSMVSLDIETAGMSGELYSIGVAGDDDERVFLVGEGESTDGIVRCPTERNALELFYRWLQEHDPDLIIGWNVTDFDLNFLQVKARSLGIHFRLGRAGETADVLAPATARQQAIARIPGRVVLDGIQLLRLGFWSFESFALENVAQEMLGRGKLIHDDVNRLNEIRRLYREEPIALAQYNLEDCRLVREIFAKADLTHFAVERACLTGLPLDRQGGSVASFDFQYLPRLHREGYVAPDLGDPEDATPSPGGYVMDSKPGLYENVLVLDFKSLYPSIIRTFRIDPLGMAFPGENPVPGFLGAAFSRDRSILPERIAELWDAREAAKHEKNQPLSTAIKIIMNSFYGVLGSPGCRFFDPRLATSITRRGHDLIQRSREWFEQQELTVIYGDTDSLFVHLAGENDAERCLERGESLARGLNTYWGENIPREFGVESHLEIEFETLYTRFFMPTMRGSELGSKKRYAGLKYRGGGVGELTIRGLEAVRTDWTPLAREFQREVFRLVFHDAPFEDYIRRMADEVLAGKLDEKLLYRKRIRRDLDSYEKNVPPHIQAARKLERPGRWVRYAITLNGPEPEALLTSPLDYGHYLDRQLAPAVDGILQWLDTSFERIAGRQMEMF